MSATIMASVDQALAAATERFASRHHQSRLLHEAAVSSMPGGNTRSLLHSSPFPVYIASGAGHQLTSVDGDTSVQPHIAAT